MVAACVTILESVESARYGGAAEGEGHRIEEVQILMRLMREVKV